MINFNLSIKRFIDISCSLIAIILLLPFFLIIAITIKLTSKGPVFFRQKRLGKNGKVFNIIKFRTMIVNAEVIGDGLTVKNNRDPRITRIGKFLRTTSLDELPQFFNVLIGDMSLIGPRPPVTYFPYKGIDDYPEWTKIRFTIRPGITGLAQVTVRNSVSWEERIKVDINYIESFSILLDMKILILTVFKFFKADNIYMEKSNTNEKEIL